MSISNQKESQGKSTYILQDRIIEDREMYYSFDERD